MDSTRPIRALMRGLDTLCVLNAHSGATVAEVVQTTRLPRTTVYRLLGTLCEAGYVHRDALDDRYRVTSQVRGLADSLDESAWVTALAHSALRACGEELHRPVAIATPAGATMAVHEPRPPVSGSTAQGYAVSRVPLLDSACGIAYLSRCATPVRDALISAARGAADGIGDVLQRTLAAGYAVAPANTVEVALGVPLCQGDRVLAALTVNLGAAPPDAATTARFLAKLQDCAARIQLEFLKNRVKEYE